MPGTAAELFRFHTWANRRLIEFCAGLDEARLRSPGENAYGSIRDTLRHLVAAERSFLLALAGSAPDPPLPDGSEVPLAELARRAERSGEALQAVAARTRPARRLRLRRPSGEREIPAVAVLAQALGHAAEHRAQVVALLWQQGVRPPDLSGWAFGGDASRDYV